MVQLGFRFVISAFLSLPALIHIQVSLANEDRKTCADGSIGNYFGPVNKTKAGVPCVRWDAEIYEIPGGDLQNIRDNMRINDLDGITHNYCRNPSKAKDANPWCYVAGSFNKSSIGEDRWQHCKVDICAGVDCFDRSTFATKPYNGKLSKTRQGDTCLFWNDTKLPILSKPNLTDNELRKLIRADIAKVDGSADHNFCRNPDSTKLVNDPYRPFCYTTARDTPGKSSWEFCSVLFCFGSRPLTARNQDESVAVAFPFLVIIAAVVACLLCIVVFIIIICLCCRCSKRKQRKSEEATATPTWVNTNTIMSYRSHPAAADVDYRDPRSPAGPYIDRSPYVDPRSSSTFAFTNQEKEVQELDMKITDEIRYSGTNAQLNLAYSTSDGGGGPMDGGQYYEINHNNSHRNSNLSDRLYF